MKTSFFPGSVPSMSPGASKSSSSFWILIMIPLWALAAVTSNVNVSIAAAIFGFLIAGRLLWLFIGNQDKMVCFVEISAYVLCIILNIGWLTAVYLHFKLGVEIDSSMALAGGVEVSVGEYALAIVYATSFSFFLSYVSSNRVLRRKESMMKNKLTELMQSNLTVTLICILILSVAELVLIASGVVGQRSFIVEGVGDTDAGNVEPWWAFVLNGLMLFQTLANGMSAVRLWQARKTGKYGAWIWLILVLSGTVLSFMFFSRGRRWLLFCILAHCWWMVFFSNSKPRFIVLFAIFGIFFPILKEVMAFNNFLRSSALELEDSKGSIINVIPEAYAKYRKYDDLKEIADENSTNNLASRPLVAKPLAACMALPPHQRSFVWEKEMVNSFIWALPGMLITNKQDYPVREVLLYSNFPIGEKDTADSMYLSSYISYGWVGILIYPVFIMVLWMAIMWLFELLNISCWIVAIVAATWLKMFTLDIGEGSTTQMLVMTRSTLITIFTYWIFKFALKATNGKWFKRHSEPSI